MDTIERLSRREKRFLVLYGLVLLMVFSPSKALGQITPVIFLGGLIFFAQIQPRTHLARFTVLGIFFIVIGIIYYAIVPEFSFINYGLIIVTLSSFLVLFCDFRYIATPLVLQRLSTITLVMLCLQALYGILQGLIGAIRNRSFDIANGDIVRGTIEPDFQPAISGGNVIFAILLSSLFLFVLATGPARWSWLRIVTCILVILAWLLASVMHTIIFLVSAMLITLVIQFGSRAKMHDKPLKNQRRHTGFMAFGFGFVIVLFLIPILLPSNLASIPYFVRTTLTFGADAQTGKTLSTYQTLVILPRSYPFQPLIGLGPGQYSSRAALIRSGRYLTGGSLGLPSYTSTATERYIMSIWESPYINARISSTVFPFYSWLSLYGELGLIGVGGLACVMLWAVLNLRRHRSESFPWMHILLTILLFYIFLLGIQDNYWEFTQAVFPAVLCWQLGYTALRVEHRARLAALHSVPHVKSPILFQTKAIR